MSWLQTMYQTWQETAIDLCCGSRSALRVSDAEYLEILRAGGRAEREMWGDKLDAVVALWESWIEEESR